MAGPAEGRVPAIHVFRRESRQSSSHVHNKPVRSQTNPFGSERFLNSSMRVIINIINILTPVEHAVEVCALAVRVEGIRNFARWIGGPIAN